MIATASYCQLAFAPKNPRECPLTLPDLFVEPVLAKATSVQGKIREARRN